MLKYILMVLFASQMSFAVGVAGCGLGSMLFEKNSFLSQSSAASSNYYTQPFGITTGTSNCSSSSWVMNDKEKIHYAELHQNELSVEMAQGGGEKLAAFAQIYGCSSKDFSQLVQLNYEKVLPTADTTAAQMVEKIDQLVITNNINCAQI